MPRELNVVGPAPLSLYECVARLDEEGFDPRNERSLANAAELLAGLAANRTFLGDILIGELGGASVGQEATAYGPQGDTSCAPTSGPPAATPPLNRAARRASFTVCRTITISTS